MNLINKYKIFLAISVGIIFILISMPANAQLADGSMVKGSDNSVYIIAKGKACWISDANVFNALGFDWKNVKKIRDDELKKIPKGWLIVKAGGNAVYVIVFGVACKVTDIPTLTLLGFDKDMIRNISDAQLKKIPQQLMVIKGKGAPIYIVNNGKAVWIPSENIFNTLGFEMKRVMNVKDDLIGRISTSSLLIRGNDQKIYLVDKYKRYWISSAALFNRLGYDWNSVVDFNDSQINKIPEGEPIK